MRLGSGSLRSAAAGLALVGAQAQAANAEFQDFFFAVCTAPSGALAARCGETLNGLGNLSGDSESSLNPSQNLSHNQPAVAAALTRSKAARERAELLRNGGEDKDESAGNPFSALINVHLTDSERNSDGAVQPERGFRGDNRAVEIGLDYAVSSRTVLGAIIGMERSDLEFDAENAGVNFTPAARAGESDSDNRYVTLFGSFALGARGFLEVSGGYEQSDGRYTRFSVFQESRRGIAQTNVVSDGQADGTTRWINLSGGFDMHRSAWGFGTFAGIMSTRSEVEGYTETDLTGSGLAMSFDETTRDSLLAYAGIRASYTISSAAGVFVPQLRVEYQSELEDDQQQVAAQFALDSSATQYLLSGERADPSSVEAGFSVSAVLPNGWMPFLEYGILLGSDGLDRQRATLGLRVEF